MRYLSEDKFIDIKDTVNIYISLARYEAAGTLLKTAIGEYGEDPRFYFLQGLLFHKQGMFSEAVEKYDKAISEDKYCQSALFNKLMILSDLGCYEDAKETFIQLDSLKQSENSMNEQLSCEHLKLAGIYAQNGVESKAMEEFGKAEVLTNNSSLKKDIKMQRINFYIKMQRFQKAQTDLNALIEEYPDFIEARSKLAYVLLLLNYADLAYVQWQQILQIDPTDELSKAYIKMFG